jgi:hypothetical protein
VEAGKAVREGPEVLLLGVRSTWLVVIGVLQQVAEAGLQVELTADEDECGSALVGEGDHESR